MDDNEPVTSRGSLPVSIRFEMSKYLQLPTRHEQFYRNPIFAKTIA